MPLYPCFTVFALLLFVYFSFYLHAAPILSPSETDLIRDRQERLLQDQQKRLDELQQSPNNPALTKPELTDETRCFEVKAINLKGASHISASKQNQLIKPFVSQCLGAKNILKPLLVIILIKVMSLPVLICRSRI